MFIGSNVFIAIRLVFSSKGRLYVTKLTLVVNRTSPLPTPLRNPDPAGTAKGCHVVTRDILVVSLAGCNTKIYKHVCRSHLLHGRSLKSYSMH